MTDEEMMTCEEAGRQVERLRAIMHRLRAPGGCPWDAEQTHESLVNNLIEECYEVVDTIERGDEEHMREELGDLLLQVVFHSEIASEREDGFDMDAVAREISEKLIRRHPHVFGDSNVQGTEAVLSQWDVIKRQEKGLEKKAYLAGVGEGLPSMLRAAKLQKKAAKVGFDWQDAKSVLPKVREELAEVEAEMAAHEQGAEASEALKNELGDLIFVTVNLVRKLGLNPEAVVERTNRKFLRRFHKIEERLEARGVTLAAASNEEMEAEWEQARREDNGIA